MRVALDISVLGLSTLSAKGRTGIFRAVESLALGLAASPACELSLVAGGESFHALYGAFDYLEATPALAALPFTSAGARQRLLRRAMRPMVRRAFSPAPPTGALDRLVRGVSGRGCERIARTRHPLPERALRGVDLLHVPSGALPPRGAAHPPRVVTVYDLIGLRFPHWCEPHVPAHVRGILDSITPHDWVIAISEATRRDLCEETGIDPERVFVIPLAASRQLFHPVTDAEALASVRARYGIPPGPYLLSLNTLEPRKNLAAAVEAFALAVERDGLDDLSLVLVGARGWKYESVFGAIERLRIPRERVVLAGYVEDADLAALYSGALAFLYPSFYEGFGLPPLEAMQCGVPVVASATSSLPEVVGVAGVLLPPDDVAGFARAIGGLYRDAAWRARLASRALEQAARFSWGRHVEQTLAAYRTILGASR